MKPALKRDSLKTYAKYSIFFIIIFGFGFFLSFFVFQEVSDTYYDSFKISNALDIFINNLFVGLTIFFLGLISVGFLSSVIVFLNGYFSGAIFFSYEKILGFWQSLQYILFHGPIEIFALLIFYVVSLDISSRILSFFKKSDTNLMIKPKVKEYIMIMISAVGLLFLASIVEYFVISLK
ncbi:stage II sporulation protein M [Bacillus swezeyi]|uniref:Stage II sporulation protein M n=1 Tax=Bacillus swezeyi TaxID=1925020 RepID=A0A5M8RP70_9BACI|nr:stage II sporulation protein M [Bacillus swezeyi]KAA6448674.1 stage II sporulation protein M [Bacillus swezeyi]KAA6481781.1 stage II sporulation protein M [Bacillus swezeyi]TYS34987.1 stage II sporulation protein M [Bacillus swezeyi]